MTEARRRPVAVVSRPHRSPAVDPALRLAMLEDVYEMVTDLEQVEPVLALVPGDGQPDAEAVVWPGARVLRCAAADEPGEILAVLAALAALEPAAAAAVVVAPDAPDLPGLLIGKLFRALGSAQVAGCPAEGGGLVALGVRVPLPDWFAGCRVGLDTADALEALGRGAPGRRALGVGPGWHRVRSPADTAALDDGLDGWELTRALLRR